MSKLFAIGPVEMFEETLEIGGKQVPYFRNDEFSQVVFSASAGLKRLLFNEKGEIILLTCSGTGAMEATIMNCFTKEDNLIVINGGSFGNRFVQICEVHEIPHKVVEVEQGETLTREMIDEVMGDEEFTGLLVNLDETSIGQLYDIEMLSELCKEKVLVVDAISAFLADEVNMDKYGIDAVILSSQKALSLAPGLSVVALSERMLKRVEEIDSKSIYFDYKDYLKNGERGQTPFTPAVRVIIELEDIVKRFEERGIENIINDTHEITEPKPRFLAPKYLKAIFLSSFENINIPYSFKKSRNASPINSSVLSSCPVAPSIIEIIRGDINTTNSANGEINVSGVVTNECVGIPTIT